ncbi:MAG: hypothetical protein JNK79_06455 [Chitinophagaceae bacterium]|nr:hypothetical protein [Chitinophagaceae bacterium]
MRRIYTYYGGTTQTSVSGVFTYNSKGNPVSLLYNFVGTGNYNHYFLYNPDGSLKVWTTNPDLNGFATERHFYKYNSAGVCIQDSALYNPAGYASTYVSTFVYDNQGRIIKETIKNILNEGGPLYPTRNPTFTYDSRGNLAVAGWKSSWYDYKINPLRQNKVFQFIFRNWSQNNPAVQPKYNSKGLPLSMLPYNDMFFNADHAWKVIYDCD